MSASGDRTGDGPEQGTTACAPAEPDPEPDPLSLPEHSSLHVEIARLGGDWSSIEPVDELVYSIAAAMLCEVDLGAAPTVATLALSSDAHVRELNRTHRGKDSATNVLSFPAAAIARPAGEPDLLGDVVLAVETLEREAAADGKPLAHHFQHLALHGLLHLAGYDHESEEDAAEMEAIEVAVLARLQIPDPYATPDQEEQIPGAR